MRGLNVRYKIKREPYSNEGLLSGLTVDIEAWHVERPFDYQQSISFMPISILLVYLYGRVNHTFKRICGLSKQVIGIV